MTVSRPIAAITAVLLLALAPAAVSAAEAPAKLLLSYDVWQGGLRALTLNSELRRGETRYRARFSAETKGLAGLIYPYSIRARSEGLIDDSGLQPRKFQTNLRKRGKKKQRDITYLDDGSLSVRNDPPRKAKKYEVMSETLQRDTLDPISAVFTVIDAFAAQGRCAGQIPVYDGRRRYDLEVTPLGDAQLAPNRYSTYSGRTERCRVTVRPLAGFKKRKKSSSQLPTRVDIWLAPVAEGTLPVPVRIEGENGLGHMVVHLVSADVTRPVQRARR